MSELSLSWSALRSHDECKQKAHLTRMRRRSPTQDIRGYFHGTVVDRVMRDWLCDPQRSAGAMVGMVEQIADREEKAAIEAGDGIVRWKGVNDKKQMLGFCRELVVRLEPILEELVVPHEYEPAKRFKVPMTIPYLDGTPIQVSLVGEIDVLVRDGQPRWHVWDLKATKDDNYWRKTVMQLVFYDIAVAEMFGTGSTDSVGLIQPMCKQPVMRFQVTQDQRTELMGRVIRMAHDIFRKDFEPKKDSAGCTYCSVRHACTKFNPVPKRLTLRELERVEDLRD